MHYIEAPHEFLGSGPAVFLAGGISDCQNWQLEVVRSLDCTNLTVLNPRRAAFPQGDADENQRQIEWEHRHLQRADLVAFWFPPQTLCPIALFELGASCTLSTPLVVGAHPHYARRFDIEAQLRLRRPELNIAITLDDIVDRIQTHPAIRGKLR